MNRRVVPTTNVGVWQANPVAKIQRRLVRATA